MDDYQIERLLCDAVFRYGDSLTIGYLMAIRDHAPLGDDVKGLNRADYDEGYLLGLEALKKGPAPAFVGYIPEDFLPFKRGQTITIPKGTVIHHRGTSERSKRARTIKIDHFISGSNLYREGRGVGSGTVIPPTSTKVVWPGGGGYWSEVDLNDLPEAVEAVQRERRLAARERLSNNLESAFEAVHGTMTEAAARTYEGFTLRVKGQATGHSYMQVDAVEPGHAVLASISIETYHVDRKLTLRVMVTSSVCQPLEMARLVYRALSTVMALGEEIDNKHCQPWNNAQ